MSVAITDELSRGSDNISPFPLSSEWNMRVSYLTVTNNTQRDAIEEWKRIAYMLCYVSDLDITYRLGSDVTIAGQVWTVEAFGVPDEVLTEDEILTDDGFIKPELISNIFLNDNFVVDSEAAMLALTTLTGNFIIRTDSGQIFVKLNNDDPSDIGDFAEITYPGTVVSVNGAVGAVVITITDLITADTAGFNTAVGATTTIADILSDISDIDSDIAAIELSLADKADLVGGTVPLAQLPYNFSNGIQLIGDDVTFGGDIDAGVTELIIDPASLFYLGNDSGGANYSFIQIDSSANSLSFGNKQGATAYFDFTLINGLGQINMTTGGRFRINDTSTVPTGIEYTNDYSATYVNRSLIDNGYANISYWKTAGTSLITAATTIRASGFALRFESGTLDTISSSKLEVGILGTNAIGITSYDGTSTSDLSFIGLINGIMTLQSTHGSELNRIQFSGSSGNIVVADTRAVAKGIEYFADYSATFTDRSLTDKAYVDSVLVGWPLHGSAVLTDDVSIFGGGNGFDMGNFTPLSYFNINALSSTLDITDVSIFPLVDNTGTYWIGRNSAGSLKSSALHLAGGAITVHGLASYDADYSAGYTNRSLVDKEYVVSVVTGGNWKTTGTTILSAPVTIEGPLGTSIMITDNLSLLGEGITLGLEGDGVIQLVSGDLATATNYSYVSLIGSDGNSGLDISSFNTSGEGVTLEFAEQVASVTAVFLDSRVVTKGIEYNADYSAGFTNRSFADWGNVWKGFGTTSINSPALIELRTESIDVILSTRQNSISLSSEDYATFQIYQVNGTVGTLKGYGTFGASNGDLSEYFYLFADYHNSSTLGTGGGMYFLDTRTITKGIEYAADYSSGFTNRSLVDWGNVWKVTGTTTLTGNATISGDAVTSRNIILRTLSSGNSRSTLSFTSTAALIARVNASGNNNSVNFTDTLSTFSYSHTAGGIKRIQFDDTAMTISDSGSAKGMIYAADYSANFVDRSLIDKGYANATYWKTIGTSTITGTTTIDIGLEILTFKTADEGVGAGSGILSFAGGGVELKAYVTDISAPTEYSSIYSAAGIWTIDDSKAIKTGIQYQADYSAGFTNRSLVDKGYAVAAFAPITGSSVYWKLNTATAQTVTTDIIIQGATVPTGGGKGIEFLNCANFGVTTIYDGTVIINARDSVGNTFGLAVNTSGETFRFVDSRPTTLGIQYGADYSSGYTDRSLVDRGYVLGAKTYAGIQTVTSSGLAIRNPANTFSYTITAGAIAANRILNVPVITATDTLAVLTLAQTLTSKTLGTGTIFSVIPTINDGITFTFNPSAGVSGINIGAHTADPSTIVNGDLWYQSTTNKYRGRQNAVAVDIQVGLSNTAALDFPSTATNLSADLTITVTGAVVGDVVALGVPNAAVFADSCYTAWVSATDTVTVRFNNYGATTRDPSSQTFKVTVFK